MLFYEFLHIILTAIAKNVNNAAIFFNKRAMRNIDRKIKHIPYADSRMDFCSIAINLDRKAGQPVRLSFHLTPKLQ